MPDLGTDDASARHRARIRRIEPGATVAVITAHAPGLAFDAGQYILIHADGQTIPMSLASAPSQLPELTLHYRSEPGSPDAAVLDRVFAGEAFDFSGPFGSVRLDEPYPGSLMIIAGGTGASQARSIVDEIAVSPDRPATTLYWCVSEPMGLYQDVYFEETAFHADWFDYRAFIDDRSGRTPLLDWLEDADLTMERFVLGGGPGFVYTILDRLVDLGVKAERVQADVFDYAPREQAPRA